MKTENNKNSKYPRKRIILIVVLAAVLILIPVIIGGIFIYRINDTQSLFKDSYYQETKKDNGNDIEYTPKDVYNDTAITPTPYIYQPSAAEPKIVNILLLGLDASTERIEAGQIFRTDTIMLLSVNLDDNTVAAISVPRDTYARIDKYCGIKNNTEIFEPTFGKINSAYTFGGRYEDDKYNKTMTAVSRLLYDIPIDYYLSVDMNVVKEIIDIMGGLWYDVDFQVEMGGRITEPGYQKLTGQQVLDYSRVRKDHGGDLKRIERQQQIILAMVKQLKSYDNLMKIPEIYSAVSEDVKTNLSIAQIASLALFANNIDLVEDVDTYTVPTVSLYKDGQSYQAVDQTKLSDIIKNVFDIENLEIDWEIDYNSLK